MKTKQISGFKDMFLIKFFVNKIFIPEFLKSSIYFMLSKYVSVVFASKVGYEIFDI